MKVFLIICTLFGQAALGQVYRWTDAEGRVHYGDRAPQASGAKELKIDSKPAAEASGLRDGELRALAAAAARGRAQGGETDSKPEDTSASNEQQTELCDEATAVLEDTRSRMRAGYRASEYNGLREKELAAKALIGEYCR